MSPKMVYNKGKQRVREERPFSSDVSGIVWILIKHPVEVCTPETKLWKKETLCPFIYWKQAAAQLDGYF